ncbi:MAG: FtsX-like permease family protein [Gemmatimonadetes bacterium]|nr:FtsX-like permease family protein [Gemmatimonadota bacterium]MBT8404544.1 FtsX-like permease family protein [Gemmatimonadota bacterium]
MIWRLAWRNLWRQRSRTLILMSAVTLSYAMVLAAMGVGDDSHFQMLDAAVEGAGGEVLVHGEGYWEARSGDILIDGAQTVGELVAAVDGVANVMPRVAIDGLLSTAVGNRPVQLLGIRPRAEVALRDVDADVVEGDRLDDTELRAPLLLGGPVAEELEVGPGDRVVLTATGADGELTRALFHVAGIVRSGRADLDEVLAYTTLEAAGDALGLDDQLVQFGVLVESGVEPETVQDRIREALPEGGAGLEVLTWREALPEMVGFIEIDDAFLYVYAVVIYLVVVFAIANTFLVSVLERVREFGLLNALGLRGGRLARLVLAETALMTALSMVLGLALALAIHGALARWGISVAAWGIEEIELAGVDLANMVMRSQIVVSKWVTASVLVAVATISSAIYPALRAARLAPAEAMRFYE